MDKEVSKDSKHNENGGGNSSPEDERRFGISVRLIELKAIKDLSRSQIKMWASKEEFIDKQIALLEEELKDIRDGQLMLIINE